jgi:hypothetical protein
MSYYPEFGAESFADIFRLAFSYIYVGIWFSFPANDTSPPPPIVQYH